MTLHLHDDYHLGCWLCDRIRAEQEAEQAESGDDR
jgi:hypothetical protein